MQTAMITERHVRRLMLAMRPARRRVEYPVPAHRQHDPRTRVHAGERQGEEARHRAGADRAARGTTLCR